MADLKSTTSYGPMTVKVVDEEHQEENTEQNDENAEDNEEKSS